VLAVIIVLIILVPILKMFMNTDLSILKATIMDDEILNTFFVTAKASFYATIMGVIFGVPMAYILARGNFKGKEILESIVDIPVIVPHSAAGIALLGVVGKKFFFGKLFNNFGLNFVGTEYGIALAMFFVSVPFLINGAKEGFKLVDDRLEFVAMTLGANKFRAFMDITLPLALRSVLSGMIMMWARGISEFGAVIILVYHPMVVSVKIFERFEGYGLNYARPIAVLLILVCLIIFFVLRILIKKKRVR
jgi:molybdate/tungstate transport system permease protein